MRKAFLTFVLAASPLAAQGPVTKDAPTAQALADKVSGAWLAFARSGNPSISQLPPWTPFNARDRATMVFDNESRVVNDPIRAERLAIWSALGYT